MLEGDRKAIIRGAINQAIEALSLHYISTTYNM